MSNPWPIVSLGKLIRLERRPVKVEPEKLYQEIGIYCFEDSGVPISTAVCYRGVRTELLVPGNEGNS